MTSGSEFSSCLPSRWRRSRAFRLKARRSTRLILVSVECGSFPAFHRVALLGGFSLAVGRILLVHAHDKRSWIAGVSSSSHVSSSIKELKKSRRIVKRFAARFRDGVIRPGRKLDHGSLNKLKTIAKMPLISCPSLRCLQRNWSVFVRGCRGFVAGSPSSSSNRLTSSKREL